MVRWVLVGGIGLLALVGLTFLAGLLLPRDHTATVSRIVEGAPEEVWAVMTEFSGFPEWRPGVDRVERLPDRDGMPVWRESGPTGRMTLETLEWAPPRRMVARIADEGLPFGGTWTYELAPEGGGTRVTITEDGEIYNPFFRFMARFVFGYEGTARTYLDGLGARMGSAAGPGA